MKLKMVDFVRVTWLRLLIPSHRHVGELLGMGEEGNDGHGRQGEVDINKVNEGETANADVERKDVEHEHVEATDVAAKDGSGVEKRQ